MDRPHLGVPKIIMKREILTQRRGDCWCCPGHDKFPDETYSSNRSKKARARDKKIEHRVARKQVRRELSNVVKDHSRT